MTLYEAIKHAEEVAEKQEELYRLCPASESEIFHCDGTKDCKTLENGKNKGCQKCAEEHRQLAEWLKDYKWLLEQKPSDDTISRKYLLNNCVVDKVTMPYVPVSKIENAPSVTLQSKYGKWIINGIGYSETYSYKLNCSCSVCGYKAVFYDFESSTNPCLEKANYVHKYCPNCGCRMVEPKESEEWVNFADDLMPIIDEAESEEA